MAYEPTANPLLAALVDLLLPQRHGLLEPVDGVLAGRERVAAVRRRHGDHDRRLSDPNAADAVGDGHPAEVVRALEVGGQVGHDLLGHALVGLVLEVEHRPAAGLDARRADEDRGAACLLVRDLRDDRRHVERLRAEPERPARDGRDERHLVAVGQLPVGRGVLAVHGVEQARRLVAELEQRPDVGNAFDAVEIPLRPAGPLAQSREEAHADLHHHESRHYDRRAGSRTGRWRDVSTYSHVAQASGRRSHLPKRSSP